MVVYRCRTGGRESSVIQHKSHPEVDALCSAKIRYLARTLRKHPTQIIDEAIDRMFRECNERPPEANLITEQIPESERLL
jgi:hypothetical protein